MTYDNCEKFVGPMPVEEFLRAFVPKAPEARSVHKLAFNSKSASNNENELITAINQAGLCPELQIVNTTNKPMKGLKPDITLFPRDLKLDLSKPDNDQAKPKANPDGSIPLSWGHVELWIENKQDGSFFRDVESMLEAGENLVRHVEFTKEAYETCGQLISYASAVHRSQFRVFSFSVGLFGEYGRLFRWDRSGVVYTQTFKWKDEPDTLLEFLWRFNFLSTIHRGHDTTVCSAEREEAEVALRVLVGHSGYENLTPGDLHKFLVYDDGNDSDDNSDDGNGFNGDDDGNRRRGPRSYIAPDARWATESLIGRSTFGYIAYDVETCKLVYLKDFWRTDLDGIEKEGDVYRELHRKGVRNIAKLRCAGDIPVSLEDAGILSLAFQRTLTQEFVRKAGRYEWCPGHPTVEPFVHYRLVLNTVGKPLSHFKSTRELCTVMRDAIVAHSDAYSKARVLHRDVSAGNILIDGDGHGILIDWDLSKKLPGPGEDAKQRRASRAGTWQFISIALLIEPTKTHVLSDDLESFFWVLLYQICRHRTMSERIRIAMGAVFDQHSEPGKDGLAIGGYGKLGCLKGLLLTSQDTQDLVPAPCQQILSDLRLHFNDLYYFTTYTLPDPSRKMPMQIVREPPDYMKTHRANKVHLELLEEASERLQSSDWMLEMFDGVLASEWEGPDEGSLSLAEFLPDPRASRLRKKRAANQVEVDSDEDDEEQNNRGKYPPGVVKKRKSMTQTSRASAQGSTLVGSPLDKRVSVEASATRSGGNSGVRSVGSSGRP
ncbi:hypothetical protein BC834DRAFT_938764 [Gloeopeniophorella convolvens]|nr:hypothetical protein BC834DRAFT_938764 [Gloeopeniophorella convolvens]